MRFSYSIHTLCCWTVGWLTEWLQCSEKTAFLQQQQHRRQFIALHRLMSTKRHRASFILYGQEHNRPGTAPQSPPSAISTLFAISFQRLRIYLFVRPSARSPPLIYAQAWCNLDAPDVPLWFVHSRHAHLLRKYRLSWDLVLSWPSGKWFRFLNLALWHHRPDLFFFFF